MRNRNRLRIIVDILMVVKDGAKKTHIMHEANLSYNLLKQCLVDILDAGLVQLGNEGRYEITDKGSIFLERCNEFFEDSQRVKEQVSDVEKKREKLVNFLIYA